jgi:hypothetical protein
MNASTARSISLKLRRRFGQRIADACRHSSVPPAFLAALISNEAGKYSRTHPDVISGKFKAGDVNENATRFEPGVYEDLISLRDRGYCFVGGKRRSTYNNITRADIATATDEHIKALSRSYQITQIMGWSMVKMLKGTLADLKSSEKHLPLAVERLEIVAGPQLRAHRFDQVLRIWNTGSPNGKTYDAAYVPNGLAVMDAYADLPAVESDAPELAHKPAAPPTIDEPTSMRIDESEEVEAISPSPGELVADSIEEPAIHDEIDEVGGIVGGAANAGDAAAAQESSSPAVQTPAIEVPQAKPEKDVPDETLKDKATKTAAQVKAWYVAIPAAIIQFFVALYKWTTDPAHQLLVFALLAGVVVVVVVFVVMNFNHSKEKTRSAEEAAKRDHELKLQREQQAFELTKLQALSAARRDQNTVRIVPQPIQNSDSAP